MSILIFSLKFVLLFAFTVAAVTNHSQKQGLDAKWQQQQQQPQQQLQRNMQNYSKELPEPITAENINIKDRIERLGYTTGYGGGLNSYGTGVGSYSPPKIDLAGVVIGSIIGLGAFLLIPKILGIFNSAGSGYYGGQSYGRSEGDTLESNTIGTAMSRLDDVLTKHNIDSTSCMQRAVCTYVRSTETNLLQGTQDQIDQFIHSLAKNDIIEYMLDGTAIKEALENGKRINSVDCAEAYKGCKMDSNTIAKVLATVFKTMTS